MSLVEHDILLPYATHHGPAHRRLRDTQQCQHKRYGNTTHSLYKAHVNQSDLSHVVDIHHMSTSIGEYYYNKHGITVRYQRVHNPERTFSVLEPGHRRSCEEDAGVRATVQETARGGNCVVAANAGFFNTHTGQCLGNIFSDGRLVQDSGGIQNAHFGITKHGQLFTGYLSEIELVTLHFRQLVGGVIWLLRNGEIYVDESRDIECPDTEETGTLDRFIGVTSARTAVGHDSEGHVLMVQVDGKTDQRGVDLREFASLLKDLGFVNAINLDGGGSATSVINGTLVNYPSDSCPNSTWNCAREVSTILCVHQAECSPHPQCSHHGECVSGQCQCRSPWSGESCDILDCPGNCSENGECLEDGCQCETGWEGEDCSTQCQQGRFGYNCSQTCRCLNNATCDPMSGACQCLPGFTGIHCQSACGYGLYGEKCSQHCSCPGQCFCHPVTGTCSNTSDNIDYSAVGQCLTSAHIKSDHLVPDQSDQLLMWKYLALSAGIIAITSIAVNIWLAIMVKKSGKRSSRSRHRSTSRKFSLRNSSPKKGRTECVPMLGAEEDSSLVDSSDEADEETALFLKRFPRTLVSDSR